MLKKSHLSCIQRKYILSNNTIVPTTKSPVEPQLCQALPHNPSLLARTAVPVPPQLLHSSLFPSFTPPSLGGRQTVVVTKPLAVCSYPAGALRFQPVNIPGSILALLGLS